MIEQNVSAGNLTYDAVAKSDQLQIFVEPRLPIVTNLKDRIPAGGVVPRLDTKTDFVDSGVVLEVDLPQASSFVTQGAQVLALSYAKTGIAGPMWFAAMMLFGVAILVRKFVTSK